jgi:hypothetical protein
LLPNIIDSNYSDLLINLKKVVGKADLLVAKEFLPPVSMKVDKSHIIIVRLQSK